MKIEKIIGREVLDSRGNPTVEVDVILESGALSDEQKEELIKRLTEVSSEIMRVPQEFFVTTIKEVSDKNFGIGGKTIDKVKEEYVKKHQ